MSRNSDWVARLREPRTMHARAHRRPAGGQPGDGRGGVQAVRRLGRRFAQERGRAARRLAATQARLAIGRRLAEKVETARHQGDQFLTKYVVDRRTASSAVYEELTRMATDAGIQAGQDSFQYDEIEGSDTLQMMTISAGFEGTYQQITKFVNLVDKSPRFFVIESMQTAAPQQNAQKLTVQFKIKTFVRGATGDES